MESMTPLRCLTVLLLAGVVPAACGSDPPAREPGSGPGTSTPPPAASSPAAPPATSSPGAPPAASSAAAPPAASSSAAPPAAEPSSAPSASPPPGGAGELPGGLPHGDRTLTGVVERAGGCTLLVVGDRKWALSGTPADNLTVGDRVTVTGQITTGGCANPEVGRTLIVRRTGPARS